MSQTATLKQILSDRQWHCPIEWNYADGHTKRFTDLNLEFAPEGLKVIGIPCDCGRHTGKVYKRKIVPINSLVFGQTAPQVKNPINLQYR